VPDEVYHRISTLISDGRDPDDRSLSVTFQYVSSDTDHLGTYVVIGKKIFFDDLA